MSDCSTTTPQRRGSTPSSTCSGPPSAWRCCSTASRTFRCATTRSAATPPASWPVCCAGSTRSRPRRSARRRSPRSPQKNLQHAPDEAALEAARREREFAELYAAHDRILAAAGSLDSGDVSLILRRLLADRADVRREIASRFRHRWSTSSRTCPSPAGRYWSSCGAENANLLARLDDDQATRGSGARTATWFRELHPDADVVVLERCLRGGSEVIDAARAVVAAIPNRLEKPGRAEDIDVPGALLALAQRARAGAGGGARGRAPDRRRRLPAVGLRRSSMSPRAAETRSQRRWRSAASPSTWPGRRRSSAGPRSATRRLAAGARRPRRLRRGGAGADPATDRAALGRPGAAVDDRAPAQARHGLRLRGGAREPADPARGPGADPGVPEALPGRLGGARGAPRRRLRAAADRAGRPAPPAPLRRPAGGGRAPAQPLAPGRAGRRPGPGASRRPRPATSSATSAPSPTPGSSSAAARTSPGAGLGPGDRARRRQGARVRPRLHPRARALRRRRARTRAAGGTAGAAGRAPAETGIAARTGAAAPAACTSR